MYAASALLMRAMLELEVVLMIGFVAGGGRGRSPPPLSVSADFSSLGFVSLIRFLSAKEDTAGK